MLVVLPRAYRAANYKRQEGMLLNVNRQTAKCKVLLKINRHTRVFTRVNGYGGSTEVLLEVIISKNSNTLHFAVYTT